MDNRAVLRRADMMDVDALSELCQKTFNETYVEDLCISYPENDLDSYFRSSASPESFANKIANPRCAVWVIEDKTNHELIAYAVVSPCNADDISHPDIQVNKDALLNRLYVRRDRRNHGFGQQLMDVVLPWLDEHYSGRSIWLVVWFKNFRAQKFYAHYGFNKVGEFEYSVGNRKELNFIMKRHTHK